ncbi:hypothetical protein [Streptomyces sp. NPDC003635]
MRGRGRGPRAGRHRLTASAGALTVTLAMLVWGAAPASAGGPTSVFLVSPETGRTAGLYYSDREYGRLDSLLRAGSFRAPPEGVRADLRITLTWLIHDSSPWRIDWIFPVSEGEDVWMRRAMIPADPTTPSWHRAADPGPIRALLSDLDLLERPGSGEDLSAFSLRDVYRDDAAAEAPAEATGAETPPAPRSTATARSDDDTGWWWALAGGAAGAALALVLRPFAARLRLGGRGEPGPRQELRDV